MSSNGSLPTRGAAAPILVVDRVSKHFGGLMAVNACSLEVEEGSVTGLIGPNGAGKSTLLGIISGFISADSGRILFRGEEVQKLDAHERSRLGLLRTFQNAREWSRLSTLENVLVASTPISDESLIRAFTSWRKTRESQKRARALAREILADFGLDHVRDELAGNLSGGQKRLLEFARIVGAEPKMVLLDEPQAGVNPILSERIIAAVAAMNSRGITVLVVEHNLRFVERICTRINVMSLGTTVAAGTMGELRENEDVVDAYLGTVDADA